jgi:GDP-L-fucose synthase
MRSGSMYNSRKILVAGGTGTIGIPLTRLLLERGADITVVSMDSPEYAAKVLGNDINFKRVDLTQFDNCLEVTSGKDIVFNLVGIKGSVGIGQSKVASYLYPMLMFQSHLMEAAFRNNVSNYLFVSSICGYPSLSSPKQEDSMWDGMPLQNDRIPGLAKRIGEIQGESYLLEHDWQGVKIVRPSNVFGPYDDFNPATAQVIPALIARMAGGENPIKVWGDGSAVRDFIFSEECAYWLLEALEKAPPAKPVNIGSGKALTIKEVAETIARNMPAPPEIQWDTDKPTGDPVRILDMEKARKWLNFEEIISFEQGIKKTIDWYLKKSGDL